MSTDKFISSPKTKEDYISNAMFQLKNIEGYIITKDYESALIKVEYLEKALKEVIKNVTEATSK